MYFLFIFIASITALNAATNSPISQGNKSFVKIIEKNGKKFVKKSSDENITHEYLSYKLGHIMGFSDILPEKVEQLSKTELCTSYVSYNSSEITDSCSFSDFLLRDLPKSVEFADAKKGVPDKIRQIDFVSYQKALSIDVMLNIGGQHTRNILLRKNASENGKESLVLIDLNPSLGVEIAEEKYRAWAFGGTGKRTILLHENFSDHMTQSIDEEVEEIISKVEFREIMPVFLNNTLEINSLTNYSHNNYIKNFLNSFSNYNSSNNSLSRLPEACRDYSKETISKLKITIVTHSYLMLLEARINILEEKYHHLFYENGFTIEEAIRFAFDLNTFEAMVYCFHRVHLLKKLIQNRRSTSFVNIIKEFYMRYEDLLKEKDQVRTIADNPKLLKQNEEKWIFINHKNQSSHFRMRAKEFLLPSIILLPLALAIGGYLLVSKRIF